MQGFRKLTHIELPLKAPDAPRQEVQSCETQSDRCRPVSRLRSFRQPGWLARAPSGSPLGCASRLLETTMVTDNSLGCAACRFVKSYRNRWTGKLMVAAAYGKKAWFFPCKEHKKHK